MPHGLDWEPTLNHRAGSAVHLDGIDVYYDFDWRQVVGHNRSQFVNGQCLARVARAHCPVGKTPALVLTTQDVQPHPRETETHFFFIVNMPEALSAAGNAAETLYARYLESEITKYAQIKELASNPEMIEAVLSVERVAAWLQDDPARRVELEVAFGDQPGDEDGPLDVGLLLRALRTLMETELDADGVAEIAAAFGPGLDRDRRVDLLRAMTEDPDGRSATGEVFVERTADRIADARRATTAYQVLLDDPNTGETAMQQFIESNLWLLGLDYAKMIPQQRLLTGTMDFILERYDGFQDLLELKDPQDPIVIVSASQGDAAPPPSAYSLSPTLGQALGQVHSYRDRLTRYPDATEDLLGLRHSRDPRLIIVIGRADRLPEHSRRVLTELNKSLHRVEVVPYDVLAKRAEAVLANVEKYLLVVSDEGDAQSEDPVPEVA